MGDTVNGNLNYVQGGDDNVNHPKRYTSHPSGVEAIEICRVLDFRLGNMFKYVFRKDQKEPLRSLLSAEWYLNDYKNNPLSIDALHAMRNALEDKVEDYSEIVTLEPDTKTAIFYNQLFQFVMGYAKYEDVHGALTALILQQKEKEANEE